MRRSDYTLAGKCGLISALLTVVFAMFNLMGLSLTFMFISLGFVAIDSFSY